MRNKNYFFKLTVALIFSGISMMVAAQTDISDQYTWKMGKLGGGGYVTGMYIHPTGSVIYCRADVSGAYRYDATAKEWINVVTANTLPVSVPGLMNYGGVASIAGAPSDPNRAYLAFLGYLLYSDDKGDHWSVSTYSDIHMEPNARKGRFQGERLSVDPNNKDIVYYGSNKDGLLVSFDGGQNWNVVSAIPVGVQEASDFPGVGTVCFDKTSEVIDGKTQVLYVTSWGEGIFKSVDGGQNWTNISPGDYANAKIEDSEIADDGTYYITSDVDKKVYKYKETTWTSISPSSSGYVDIAIDPTNSEIIYLTERGGNIRRSSNGGTSFSGNLGKTYSSPEIPWHATEEHSWFSTAEIEYNPVDGKLWVCQGLGMWYATENISNIAWISHTMGIEELCVTDMIVPTAGHPVLTCLDNPVFAINDLEAYPDHYGPNEEFNAGWRLDYSANNPEFIVACIQGAPYNNQTPAKYSGYSLDGGNTWNSFGFETTPGGMNENSTSDQFQGNIVVSSTNVNNIIWQPINHLPWYSKDTGKTWHESNIDAVVNDFGNNMFFDTKHIVADKVNGNTFYLYASKGGKIYKTTDGGENWTFTGGLVDNYGTHAKLRSVPGQEGHLFFCKGPHNFQGVDDNMGPLYRSVDGGTTWTLVSNTEKISDVAFGAAPEGGLYPTVYVNGKMFGTYGIYRSTDNCESWQMVLEGYPLGIFAFPVSLQADPEVFGRVYLATNCIGFMYGDTGPYIETTLDSLTVGSDSTSRSFYLYTNTEWTISTNENWVYPQTISGTGSAHIELGIASNNSADSRIGSLIISSSETDDYIINIQQLGINAGGSQEVVRDTIYPLDDAYTRYGANIDNNFGTEVEMVVRDQGDFGRTSWLKFDLTAYSESVNNATLKLYVSRNDQGNTIRLFEVTNNSWDEEVITGNSEPATGEEITSFITDGIPKDAFFELDITSIVNSTIAGDKILSFTMKGDKGNWFNFNSKEHSMNHPLLDLLVSAPKFSVQVSNGSGSGYYNVDENVTIIADAAPDTAEFDSWTGNIELLANPTALSATFAMPAENVSFTATYRKKLTPPVLSLNSPSNGAIYNATDDINIIAEATGISSAIKEVNFYIDDLLTYTDTETPFEYLLTNVQPGEVKIGAEAVDEDNLTSGISSVIIKVNKPRTPYNGNAFQIPGIIPAEEFDEGGEGLTYHDDNFRQGSSSFRNEEMVDIFLNAFPLNEEDSLFVGTGREGEWLIYSINVTETGNYDVTIQAACPRLETEPEGSVNERGTIEYFIDDTKLGEVILMNTSDLTSGPEAWQTWAPFKLSNITLTSGEQTFKYQLNASANVNNIIIEKSPVVSVGSEIYEKDITWYPNPVGNQLNIILHDKNVNADIAVFNSTGTMIIHQKSDASNLTVITENLQPGFYYFRIQIENGQQSEEYIGRFIKK